MAEDHSQNMDVIGKKELGWTIPRVLAPGTHVDATNWQDTKANTHRIDWQQPDGTPYTLQGPAVNNGEAYVAALPGRRIIDPTAGPVGQPRLPLGRGQRLRLRADRRPQPRPLAAAARERPGGNAGDADVQVELRHRVGLRLRLRPGVHRQRPQLRVAAVGERLHDSAPRTPTPTAARPSSATGSPGPARPTTRARLRSTASSATTPTRRSSTTSTT